MTSVPSKNGLNPFNSAFECLQLMARILTPPGASASTNVNSFWSVERKDAQIPHLAPSGNVRKIHNLWTQRHVEKKTARRFSLLDFIDFVRVTNEQG